MSKSSVNKTAALVRGIVLSIAFAMLTPVLTACGSEDDPIGDATTSPDGPVQLDGGIDGSDAMSPPDAPQLDVCQQQDPPPQGAYVMSGKDLRCGILAAPGDHNSWAFAGSSEFNCVLDVHPDTETGTICVVLCAGHFGADYTNLVIERAGLQGPFRFYYTPVGNEEYVCYDPSTLPSQS